MNYQLDKILDGHSNSVNSLIFIDNNSRLISGSSDRTIKIWNAKNYYACEKTI